MSSEGLTNNGAFEQLKRGYGFVASAVTREFNIKYKTSVLGALWAVLNPIALVFIYTIVFTHLMKARLPGVSDVFGYGIYLCAGILCWSCFSEVVSRGQNIFIENANIIKKLSFPKLCLPVVVGASAVVSFSVLLAVIVVFALISGFSLGFELFYILPVLLLQLLLSLSIALFLGVLNVFIRDVGQLMGVVLQFWFWLTPIVYPVSILPPQIKALVDLNPLTAIVSSYQNLFLYSRAPDWGALLPVALLTVLMMLIALGFYKRNSTDMVDSL